MRYSFDIMTTDIVTVSVHSRNNRDLSATAGTITRINWETADHAKNAVKTIGIGLGATFASVFIPILHFILVPSLFIATWVFALDKFREKRRNDGGSGECPKCHQTFAIVKSGWTDRLTDTCTSCHDDLEILIPQE